MKLVLGVELLAADAVEALVLAELDVSVVVDFLEDLLDDAGVMKKACKKKVCKKSAAKKAAKQKKAKKEKTD